MLDDKVSIIGDFLFILIHQLHEVSGQKIVNDGVVGIVQIQKQGFRQFHLVVHQDIEIGIGPFNHLPF